MLRYIPTDAQAQGPDKHYYLQELKSKMHDMFSEASMMLKLCKQFNMSQSEVSKALGISQSSVGNKIRLLSFSADEQHAILQHKLSERHARTLLRIKGSRINLIKTVASMHLTVEQTEQLVDAHISRSNFSQANTLAADFRADLHSSVAFFEQTQQTADKLRAKGSKIACLVESGDGWKRMVITVKE